MEPATEMRPFIDRMGLGHIVLTGRDAERALTQWRIQHAAEWREREERRRNDLEAIRE